jgi:hypothetical protein
MEAPSDVCAEGNRMTLTQPAPDTPVQAWSTGLHLLIGALAVELHNQADVWACRAYRDFQIGLTLREDRRKVLRIARTTRPEGTAAWDRHREQVDLIRQHLGITKWERLEIPDLSEVSWWGEPRIVK